MRTAVPAIVPMFTDQPMEKPSRSRRNPPQAMCAHPASPAWRQPTVETNSEDQRSEPVPGQRTGEKFALRLPSFYSTHLSPLQPEEGSALQLAPALRQRAQAQWVESDETLRVVLIVAGGAVLERHEILIVERIGALAADHGDLALVELEPHPAADELLAEIDRRLQHLALRREPEAVVDQLGIARHQLVLEVRRAAIERDLLDAAMGREQDRAARSLVHAPRLHADETVFDEIKTPDAIGAAEF